MLLFLSAALLPSKTQTQIVKTYKWDLIRKLYLGCILENDDEKTIWLNDEKIIGPQNLGKRITILKITNNYIDLMINQKQYKLQLNQTLDIETGKIFQGDCRIKIRRISK